VSAGLIAVLFVLAQVCDGVLTYVAVQRFGLVAEANPLLVTWMAFIGPAPALAGAKLLAAFCGVVLYACGVHRILLALTILYTVVAVGPWVAFFTRL
jgi:hypothetical protein